MKLALISSIYALNAQVRVILLDRYPLDESFSSALLKEQQHVKWKVVFPEL